MMNYFFLYLGKGLISIVFISERKIKKTFLKIGEHVGSSYWDRFGALALNLTDFRFHEKLRMVYGK